MHLFVAQPDRVLVPILGRHVLARGSFTSPDDLAAKLDLGVCDLSTKSLLALNAPSAKQE